MPTKFIVYEHSSGEIYWIDRNSIKSFHPVPYFANRNFWRVMCIVGEHEFPLQDCNSREEARDWCLEQIALIEGNTNVSQGQHAGSNAGSGAGKASTKLAAA